MSDTDRDVYLHATPSANPSLGPIANASFTRVLVNEDGTLWTSPADANGNPITSDAITVDGVVPSALPGGTLSLNVAANLRALNAAGNLDRVRTLASDADAQVAAQLGLLGAVARAQRFNGATWDRARSLASDTDAQVAAQLGLTGAVVRPYIFNGATYDRQRAPVSFTSAGATAAGLTAIVAGVGGQTIRLLRYSISLTSQATSAAGSTIRASFADGAVVLSISDLFFAPAAVAASAVGLYTTGWIDLGPIGFVGTVGAALNLNLSVALTAGNFNAQVAYIQGVTT